jgi:hypothetical protein
VDLAFYIGSKSRLAREVMGAYADIASFDTENGRASQQLGRASALAQTGFCGWQERIGHRSKDQS